MADEDGAFAMALSSVRVRAPTKRALKDLQAQLSRTLRRNVAMTELAGALVRLGREERPALRALIASGKPRRRS